MVAPIGSMIYTPQHYQAELELAHYLVRLAKQPCQKVSPVTDGLKDSLKFKQPEAVLKACENSLSVLTGPPGTGKTTTTQAIVQSFKKAGMVGAVACPTGKAAKRAKEVIREPSLEYSTTHVALEWSPRNQQFMMDRVNRFKLDYLIVDEFPMNDTLLACSLFEAIDHKRTRVVLVGDEHQLPSIGPGNIARDIIASKCFQVTILDEILRQGANSGIVHNAKRILNGDSLIFNDPKTGAKFTDFYFIPSTDAKITADTIVKYVADSLPAKRGFDPFSDTQVLCPGKKAIVGTVNMNKLLQERLNPNGKKYGGFRIGDKVLNNDNNREKGLVNGDLGLIEEREQGAVIDFGPGAGADGSGFVPLPAGGMESLSLAFAFTVHKSQGSEFKAVIIPMHCCHSTQLYRNLFYTGITRGREMTVVIGEPKAVDIAINTNKAIKRCSRLQSIIRELYGKSQAA